MAKIVRDIDIEAPIDVAYDTIADFSSYTTFLEGMKDVKVLEQEETHAKVTFTLDLFKRIVYTLDIDLKKPTTVSWTLAEADMMKHNNGGWKLKKIDTNTTNATYTIDIDFKIWVPGPISTFLVNTSVPSTLESFKKEIEKRAAK